MAIYTKNFEEFENLTVLSKQLIFLIKHVKDKIQVAGFFCVWSFFIMLSTFYTDGIHTLVCKLAMVLFGVIFILFIYFLVQYIIHIRNFNSVLKQLKDAERALDSHLGTLSRY